MTTLQVFVKSCSEASGSLELDRGGSVTAHIPARNHENLIRIQKKFAEWKVELSRAHPGFGKPYLMLLTNENKVCRNCACNSDKFSRMASFIGSDLCSTRIMKLFFSKN